MLNLYIESREKESFENPPLFSIPVFAYAHDFDFTIARRQCKPRKLHALSGNFRVYDFLALFHSSLHHHHYARFRKDERARGRCATTTLYLCTLHMSAQCLSACALYSARKSKSRSSLCNVPGERALLPAAMCFHSPDGPACSTQAHCIFIYAANSFISRRRAQFGLVLVLL